MIFSLFLKGIVSNKYCDTLVNAVETALDLSRTLSVIFDPSALILSLISFTECPYIIIPPYIINIYKK